MYEFMGFLRDGDSNSCDRNLLKHMKNSIWDSEADSRGIYTDGDIFLCLRGSNVLTWEDDRYYLILSGQIYNYSQLKKKLIGIGVETGLDTEGELILSLFRAEGRDFVTELRGMFAFVIWDKLDKTLFGGRDPFGIKPFYYMDTPRGFYFGSNIKAFSYDLDRLDNLGINITAIQDYLTYQYVPEPNTMVEDIYTLEPSSTIEKVFDGADATSIDRYWNIQFNPIERSRDSRVQEIRQVLRESVEHHMVGDAHIGSFLSGGIDSSIIVALAREIDPNIKTFTAGFDVAGYSEIDLAREIANEFGIENISKVITPEDIMLEFPNIIWHMDVPVADPSAIPLYFISREARRHVEVVLSGEGADEFFGGYNIYREPISLNIFSYISSTIKNRLISIANLIPEGVRGKGFIRRGCTPIEKRYVGNAYIFREEEKSRYLKNYDSDYTYDRVTINYFDQAIEYDDIAKMQYIDMHTWLRGDILVKSERMTKAHSLEMRTPFMDRQVFEVASKLTLEDKIQGRTTKYMLREAFKDILPREVPNRRKLGYPVPIRVWLRDELYDWAVNIVKISNTEEYIDRAEVLKLIEAHRRGHIDNSRKIWAILTFMIWHEILYSVA